MKCYFAAAVLSALCLPVSAATIVALGESGGNVFSFDSATPGTVVNNQSLTGVPAGQSPRAIDFNPADGRLYMLSTGSTTSDARLYTVNVTTGAATVVAALTLTGATGTRHSMDWNPVTGRLHIVSASSRTHITVDSGTFTVANFGLFGTGTLYTGLAFDNNTTGSASTTAYVFDYTTDELRRVTDIPTSAVTTVSTPFAPFLTGTGSQGFDIAADGTAFFNTDMFDGPQSGGADHLFSLNLSGGSATHIGQIGLPALDISAMPVPEPSSATAALLAAAMLSRRRRS